VVAGLAAAVAVGEAGAGVDDEHAAELEGVALDAGLAEAARERAERVQRRARREQLEVPAAKPRGPIGAELRIDENGHVEREVVPERAGEVRRAASHDRELGAARADLGERIAQLRDLLAAEQSAEVAQEREHDRALRPERADPHALASPVRELEGFELRDRIARAVARARRIARAVARAWLSHALHGRILADSPA
jgi:hypothetical protein